MRTDNGENAGQSRPGHVIIIVDDTMSRILPYNPQIYTGHALKAVTPDDVLVKKLSTGEEKNLAADYVVLSLGVSPRRGMLEKYASVAPDVITVGDNVKSGRIPQAIRFSYMRTMDFLK